MTFKIHTTNTYQSDGDYILQLAGIDISTKSLEDNSHVISVIQSLVGNASLICNL